MPSFNKGSYTEYSNKIGLYSNNQESFISQSPDVVLNFPYKDCVLEGGMTKEDAKRDERFLNIKIDKNDIDTLFDSKVLTGCKYIDSNGEHELSADDDIDFFDKNGELKQNLLIKGNNLIALHTLKEKLTGKVKLIYIDPPYNTGNDGFRYNDSFNHSAWLAFMKNRLEIARKLLADDGAIYVNIDFHEAHYLKVLMDEVFGIENFQREIIWRIGWLSGYKTLDKNYIRNHDSILFYSKNYQLMCFNKTYINNKDFKELVRIETLRKAVEACKIDVTTEQLSCLADYINHGSRPEKYPIEDTWNSNEYDDLNSIAIVSFAGETVSKMLGDKTLEIKGQKSEKLLERIVTSHTEPGDIVLDFHLGSGTTAAVAHKMGRRWIGIEQMDYIETIAKERLKKVIAGEQGGISKSVNWQGGGSFVYMELKKYNQEYVDQINAATNMTELEEVYKKMYQNAFLKFWFDKKTFERDERFRSMDLNTRKQALISILDENQLYLNYADMDDAKYHVSDNERALTKRFYGDDSDDSNDTEAGD